MADDDRPRVDLGDPFRPGLGTVGDPYPAVARAGSHERGGGVGVWPGGGAVGSRAIPPTDGLDRDAGLAEDPDVPPRGPLRDAELVGKPLRGDARAVLDQFKGQQGTCGGARVEFHGPSSISW
jgi:hypothetical protein